jgi:hypothetical protein
MSTHPTEPSSSYSRRVLQLEQQSHQLNTLFSSVLRQAEERFEAILGEQVCIELDVDSVTSKRGKVGVALSTLTDQQGDLVFGRLERALRTVCANTTHRHELALLLEEIRITNLPGHHSIDRRCQYADGVLTYYGVFGKGARGCLSEQQLVQHLELAIGARTATDNQEQDSTSSDEAEGDEDQFVNGPSIDNGIDVQHRSSFTDKVLAAPPPVFPQSPMVSSTTSTSPVRRSASGDERTPLVSVVGSSSSNPQVVDETCCTIL